MFGKKWHLIEQRLPRSPEEVIEILLRNRGLGASFFDSSLGDLQAYLCIQGLQEGAQLMARHLHDQSKIVLVGDYDCDGVTSIAQVSLFLKEIGYSKFRSVIPHRYEGYGMPKRVVIENPDASLFVTLDCGTSDVESVSMARAAGAECIVIDHHEVPAQGSAPASVLINPKQPNCPSVFKEFCSAGLTLLFLAALRKALRGTFSMPKLGGKYLELAALGTVADLVPLVEGNRIIVRNGLSSINRRGFSPIRHMIDSSGLSGKVITSGHLGYYLGPRINAAGRMDDATTALDLLLAERDSDMQRHARELNRLNGKRQYQEDSILTRIADRFRHGVNGGRTVVMWDDEWPPGIVGIVASRVQQELHYGPAIIFSIDKHTRTARGSARSVPGFDLHSALGQCEDLMIKWGGHKMAAGMTIHMENLQSFAERFESVAQTCDADVFIPKGRIDLEIAANLISPELMELLKPIEPHGLGNPIPNFILRQATPSGFKIFGREKKHVRLHLNGTLSCILWRGWRQLEAGQLKEGSKLDVVFQLEWDDYRQKPLLVIKDFGRFLEDV